MTQYILRDIKKGRLVVAALWIVSAVLILAFSFLSNIKWKEFINKSNNI